MSRKWRMIAGWTAGTAPIAVCVVTAFLLPLPLLYNIGENYLIPAAFWSAVGFILIYSLLSPWWRNPIGRMIVRLDASVALALASGIMVHEFGVPVGGVLQTRILVLSLALVTETILSRVVLIGRLHGWRIGRPRRKASEVYPGNDPAVES
jgi:hypothetical protein